MSGWRGVGASGFWLCLLKTSGVLDLAQGATIRSQAIHGELHVSSGAEGWREFSVRSDPGKWNAIATGGIQEKLFERCDLGGGWRLGFKVAQRDDAEVAVVLIFDVCALVGEASAFPYLAEGIDDKVIADVSPASGLVCFADEVDAPGDGSLAGQPDRRHAVVMHGDAFDAVEAIHSRGDGVGAGPC